jgi:4-diphosphocytidyl-2-C-methyl-D-erythritol kinase
VTAVGAVAVHDEPAYGKVNLCLVLGPTREDGRHELVTLFESVSLADTLTITPRSGGEGDEVVCEAVPGSNLVADALAALRARGWAAPPLTVAIVKRIPVAAGMGGGSADAAAMLRRAPAFAAVDAATVAAIAAGLGADVPGQLAPGPSIGTGAGERIAPVGDPAPHALLVLPQPTALPTAAVYREADRLGQARAPAELQATRIALERAVSAGAPLHDGLVVNDLAPAALSLCPQIGDALASARDAGADQAIVCGSGPTAIGIFWGADAARRARAALDRVRPRYPQAVVAGPVRGGNRPLPPNH